MVRETPSVRSPASDELQAPPPKRARTRGAGAGAFKPRAVLPDDRPALREYYRDLSRRYGAQRERMTRIRERVQAILADGRAKVEVGDEGGVDAEQLLPESVEELVGEYNALEAEMLRVIKEDKRLKRIKVEVKEEY